MDEFFGTGGGVLLDRADGRRHSECAFCDIHTNDDGILLVEDSNGLEYAGEDGQHL